MWWYITLHNLFVLLQICDISARIAALKSAGLNVDTQSRFTRTKTIPVMVLHLCTSMIINHKCRHCNCQNLMSNTLYINFLSLSPWTQQDNWGGGYLHRQWKVKRYITFWSQFCMLQTLMHVLFILFSEDKDTWIINPGPPTRSALTLWHCSPQASLTRCLWKNMLP